MRVSELAKKAGVTPETVRYYTRQGLLHPQRDPKNGYQRYGHADYRTLVFIRKARQLGFSLKEITQILREAEKGHSPCPLVRDLFERRFAEICQKIETLTRLRDRMAEAMDTWQRMPDGQPDGHTICRLIEHWEQEDGNRERFL
ncbi:MAG: MerR family transcriptional regulator [Hydrogenophilus thermoluteolus]